MEGFHTDSTQTDRRTCGILRDVPSTRPANMPMKQGKLGKTTMDDPLRHDPAPAGGGGVMACGAGREGFRAKRAGLTATAERARRRRESEASPQGASKASESAEPVLTGNPTLSASPSFVTGFAGVCLLMGFFALRVSGRPA